MENLKEQAQRAYNWNSFSPEKRANEIVNDHASFCADLREMCAGNEELFETLKARYEKKLSAWLSAKSRTASPMITGPARFPTERNRRALETEHKRLDELCYFEKNARKIAARVLNPPVSNDEAYLASLKARLDNTNGGYSRSLLRDKIERVEQRIRVSSRGDSEIGGVRIVRNAEAQRIQLFYPSKPDDSERAKLKSHGFKWSPRFGAWQRQLTENAERAVKIVLGDG